MIGKLDFVNLRTAGPLMLELEYANLKIHNYLKFL